MVISKSSLLGVTLPLPIVDSVRRNTSIETDRNGLRFVVYSGEREPVTLTREFIPDLLDLVKPFEKHDRESKEGGRYAGGLPRLITDWSYYQGSAQNYIHVLDELHLPPIDPLKVERFLNRWGMVGLTCTEQRNAINSGVEPNLRAELLGFRSHKKTSEERAEESEKLVYHQGKIRTEYLARSLAIRRGDQIPYLWVEFELQALAGCVRIVINLLREKHRSEDDFALTVRNRKRILAGWGVAPIAIPDDKDPAKYRTLDDAWNISWEEGGIDVTVLDSADVVLHEFTDAMNTYLKPLSSMIVRTETIEEAYRQNLCFETALATYLVDLLRKGGTPTQCKGCQRLYFPRRQKQDTSRNWCSPRCGANVRMKDKRERDRSVRLLKTGIPQTNATTTRKKVAR